MTKFFEPELDMKKTTFYKLVKEYKGSIYNLIEETRQK